MVHAEKIVTAVQRGTANTRWRDFGDIWSLSRQHSVTADELTWAIEEVAIHRKATIRPLVEVLDDYAELGRRDGSSGVVAATLITCPSNSQRCSAPRSHSLPQF